MTEQTQLLNKKVKIFLKNQHCYTGEILSITEKNILLLDKFNLHIDINRDEISTIVEQK